MAEGDPDLPFHPRHSAEPLGHLKGLLSVEVRQLEHAVLVVYVAGELDMLTGPPLQGHLGELLATRPDQLSSISAKSRSWVQPVSLC